MCAPVSSSRHSEAFTRRKMVSSCAPWTAHRLLAHHVLQLAHGALGLLRQVPFHDQCRRELPHFDDVERLLQDQQIICLSKLFDHLVPRVVRIGRADHDLQAAVDFPESSAPFPRRSSPAASARRQMPAQRVGPVRRFLAPAPALLLPGARRSLEAWAAVSACRNRRTSIAAADSTAAVKRLSAARILRKSAWIDSLSSMIKIRRFSWFAINALLEILAQRRHRGVGAAKPLKSGPCPTIGGMLSHNKNAHASSKSACRVATSVRESSGELPDGGTRLSSNFAARSAKRWAFCRQGDRSI